MSIYLYRRFLPLLLPAALLAATTSAWAGARASGPADKPYDRRTPIVEAFEKTKPAVVSITGRHPTRSSDIFSLDWDLWPFRRQLVSFLGTGFIIHPRGYIITNTHVIDKALEVVINLDEVKYPAKVIAQDHTADLALLKIDANRPLPTVALGRSDDLMIGETVLAIGNPFGYQQTVTDGIVSAIHRNVEIGEGYSWSDLIQISAPINPGNSGGPLLNINGEVIGINTAIRQAAQGIGFAIPIDRLRLTLPLLINIDTLRRIDFGLTVRDPQSEGSAPEKAGLIVQATQPGGAADRAGFKIGDVITVVDGKKTSSAINFYLDMVECPAGSKLAFEVWRKTDAGGPPGQNLTVTLELRERPKPEAVKLAERMLGMKVDGLSEQLARRYGIYGAKGSVVVLRIERGSPADKAGIRPGDILAAMNDDLIENIEQLGLKLEVIPAGAVVKLTITRSAQPGLLVQYETTLRTRSDNRETTDSAKKTDL